MANKIPNSVIGAVASVIAAHYYSHSRLNTLFLEAGAPGDSPEGNCEAKCAAWLRRCNDDPSTDALDVLGRVAQAFLDMPEPDRWPEVVEGQRRICDALARNQLGYQLNGKVSVDGSFRRIHVQEWMPLRGQRPYLSKK